MSQYCQPRLAPLCHTPKSINTVIVATAGGSHDDLLIDATGAAHARLGGDDPSLCVVRPDGHLGLRLTPPTLPAVESYFTRILA